MNKIADMVISAILKKGIINEARDMEIEIRLPEMKATATIRIGQMTTRLERDSDE